MTKSSRTFVSLIACTILALPSALLAHTPVPSLPDSPALAGNADSGSSVATVSSKPVPTTAKPLTSRWLDLKTLSFSQRYRNAYNQDDVHVFENGQERSLIEGRVKLDAQDRYAIGFRASSGRYFNWAYADYAGSGFTDRVFTHNGIENAATAAEATEILNAVYSDPAGLKVLNGLQSAGWEFYMRELYISATPVAPVTFEFGSFGIERGLSSEITTFDEDGYLSGERVRVHDPKKLFFDQIGFTSAFFGDIGTPNLFARGASLKQSNYRQVFFDKQVKPWLGFSGEYTRQVGTNTLREAVAFKTANLKVVDGAWFEAYQRLNTITFAGVASSSIGPISSEDVHGAPGFAFAVNKKLGSHLSGDFGFASVDKDYAVYAGSRMFHATGFSLNGDAYSMGKRPFMHASYKVNSVITAFGFYTHAVGEKVSTLNQQNLNAGLNFDLKALVNTKREVF